jgi:hypothetical protein
VDRQRWLLPSIVGALTNISGGGPIGVRVDYYAGVEGLRQVYMNSLEAEGETRSYVHGDMDAHVDYGFADAVREQRVRRGINVREIDNRSRYHAFTRCAEYVRRCHSVRFIDRGSFEITLETMMYNDVYAVCASHEGAVYCAEVRGDRIVRMQRQLFDIVWSRGLPMKSVNDEGARQLAGRRG